jgi:hypothetical protein
LGGKQSFPKSPGDIYCNRTINYCRIFIIFVFSFK